MFRMLYWASRKKKIPQGSLSICIGTMEANMHRETMAMIPEFLDSFLRVMIQPEAIAVMRLNPSHIQVSLWLNPLLYPIFSPMSRATIRSRINWNVGLFLASLSSILFFFYSIGPNLVGPNLGILTECQVWYGFSKVTSFVLTSI